MSDSAFSGAFFLFFNIAFESIIDFNSKNHKINSPKQK